MDDIIDISTDFSKSTNFGGGIELLMNSKKPDKSGKSSGIDIDDLNDLETELNNLSNLPNSYETNTVRFDDNVVKMNFNDNNHDDNATIKFADDILPTETKTWDGYEKFSNVSIPDVPKQPNMSSRQLLTEKLTYLKKLENLEKSGVQLTKKYTIESDLQEMICEYDVITQQASKESAIKFQGELLTTLVHGIELLNEEFDPFDFKLKGLSYKVSENIHSYDDIFEELHKQYGGSISSVNPIIKLMFQLAGTAVQVHATNTMLKSFMPSADDMMRQHPDLMQQFQNSVVNSMSKSAPGFAGFMNNVANSNNTTDTYIPRGAKPPSPISVRESPDVGDLSRGGNNNTTGSSYNANNYEPNVRSRRPDMKGPSDITDILSGIKTRTVEIPHMQNDSSTISVDELKNIQTDANIPKRSRRRPKSDKNTVSLDI